MALARRPVPCTVIGGEVSRNDQHRETFRAAACPGQDGHLRPMHALLEEDPASVAVRYQAMISRIGWKKAQRQLGISLPGGHAPTLVDLNHAAREYGWSVITLTGR